nr:MAG TPA: hypothetical protein [Caudoviricetes sp.]
MLAYIGWSTLQFKSLYCFVSICTHFLLIGLPIYCICSDVVFYNYSS